MVDAEYFEIDNKEYVILNEIQGENYTYYYLLNLDNTDDILIRKKLNDDTLFPLDNIEEFKYAVSLLKGQLSTTIE